MSETLQTPTQLFLAKMCADSPDGVVHPTSDSIIQLMSHAHDLSAQLLAAQRKVVELEAITTASWREKADAKRYRELHDGPCIDEQGYEWGVYRVKWQAGKPVEVWHTLSDSSDFDTARWM